MVERIYQMFKDGKEKNTLKKNRKRERDLLVRGQFNVLLNALFAAPVLLSVVIRPVLITVVSLFTRGAPRLVVLFLFLSLLYFRLLISIYSKTKLQKQSQRIFQIFLLAKAPKLLYILVCHKS